jgi:hypothetical protein
LYGERRRRTVIFSAIHHRHVLAAFCFAVGACERERDPAAAAADAPPAMSTFLKQAQRAQAPFVAFAVKGGDHFTSFIR